MNLATHCATINGAMVCEKLGLFKCFKFVFKSIRFAVTVHNRAMVLLYFKAAEKPGQSSEKLSPGTVPLPPEV